MKIRSERCTRRLAGIGEGSKSGAWLAFQKPRRRAVPQKRVQFQTPRYAIFQELEPS
jgi:hypothetical protein